MGAQFRARAVPSGLPAVEDEARTRSTCGYKLTTWVLNSAAIEGITRLPGKRWIGMVAPDGDPCCKVSRVARAYDLGTVDDELRDLHASGASMRELARHLNTAIVEAAIDATGEQVAADPVGVYEVLHGDDAGPERRVRIEDALEAAGVDVDALASDLVSHVTVWNHVKDHLAVETARETAIDASEARAVIDRARDREETLIANTIERLGDQPDFDWTDVDVTLSVRVFCRECGASSRLDEYLDAGGCHCQQES